MGKADIQGKDEVKGMNTAALTEAILLAASEDGCRLFRNNQGKFKDQRGVWITFGVGPKAGGGSDLLGWTAEGLFLGIEIKVGRDKPTPAQLMWIDWVIKGNGRAGVARSVEDARAIWRATSPASQPHSLHPKQSL